MRKTRLSMRSEPAVPEIAPVDPGGHRPRFSVMLPTYEPGEMLRRSLESVLVQAPPPERMQIAVVDDGSRRHDIARLVRDVDPAGRVELHVGGPRLGISGNCNRAIRLSRGHLVHLLHQDDMVLPGFYARMEYAFLRAPLIGMAFCRSRIVDGSGTHLKTNSRQRWWPGILSNWLPRIALRQRVQTPSVVVARSTYEWLGGYRTDLCHALDWEMWVRIAARMPVWYDPAALAVFRRHPASESSRLFAHGATWPDLVHAIRIHAESLPDSTRASVVASSARWYSGSALREAGRRLRQGDHDAAAATLRHARGLFKLVTDARARKILERRAVALEHGLPLAMRAA
jgi:glycosyltransferase involved in cell wall biosynthesis